MLNFVIKDRMIKVFGRRYDPKKDGYWKWFLSNLAAGTAAGIYLHYFRLLIRPQGVLSLAIIYPLDYVQTRLFCDVKVTNYALFDSYGL